MTKIGVIGCAGRMGRMLVHEVQSTPGAELSGGTERKGSEMVGRDLGELLGVRLGLAIGDDARALFDGADAVIDFSTPSATVQHARMAAETGKVCVIGTTGLPPEDEAVLKDAARSAPLVWSANMSVGVNLLLALVEKLAATLDPTTFDIEVLEMHHRHKVDAPSGTALALGKAAAAGRGQTLDQAWRKARDGHTGARPPGEIGFATLRGGDVVGDHTVIFAADGERIEIAHKASSRQIFARGAVRAALWAHGRPPGLYSMKDVLGL